VIGKSLRDIPLTVLEVTEFERSGEKSEQQKNKASKTGK
jgi:hypothetical protein